MKRVLPILIFAFCLLRSIFASDLVVSNNAIICIFGDSYMISDASAGVVTGYRFTDYLESYFQLNYPGSNIHVFNLSRSGGTMDDVLTNRIQQLGLALWAYQFNNYQHIGISQPTDNGSLSSNNMFLAQSNIFLAPGLMSDGTSTLNTHTGWSSTNNIQWIALGDPPGSNWPPDGGYTTVKLRNDASTNAGYLLGIRGVDSFNILSNGWCADIFTNSAKNVQMVLIPAEHFLSAGGLSWVLSFLRGITTDTNISGCVVDFNAALVASSNHCGVTVSKSGNTLTLNRTDTRLPMTWDIPDGTITNDARPAFVLNPSDGQFFHYDLQITNLPVGNYDVTCDGVFYGRFSDSALAAGLNMFTNMPATIAAQQKEVLGRIRDKNHIDRVTLAHGSVDGTGLWSYTSQVSTYWGGANQFRGDALISSAITNNVNNLWSLDSATATAATPTNHIWTVAFVQPAQSIFAPFHR